MRMSIELPVASIALWLLCFRNDGRNITASGVKTSLNLAITLVYSSSVFAESISKLEGGYMCCNKGSLSGI